jgi:hypothetical protein
MGVQNSSEPLDFCRSPSFYPESGGNYVAHSMNFPECGSVPPAIHNRYELRFAHDVGLDSQGTINGGKMFDTPWLQGLAASADAENRPRV